MAAFLAAVPGFLSAGTKIWGGRNARKAAGAASNIQAGAYNDAMELYLKNLGVSNSYLSNASQGATQMVGDAANFAQGLAGDTARGQGQYVIDTANAGATNVADQARQAGDRVTADTQQANALLDPYVQGGVDAQRKLSDLAGEKFTFSVNDPSYQWRLREGQKALERSHSAKGMAQGGAAAKSLMRYGQGLASTEYANEFGRWDATRRTSGSLLSDLSSRGLAAAGQSGTNTINAGKYAGTMNYDAAQYGGAARDRAAQYSGSMNYDAAKYAGNVGIDAAEYGGNMGYRSAFDIAANNNSTTRSLADLTLGRADSLAAGILGQAQAKNQMIGGYGQAALSLSDLISNYFQRRRRYEGPNRGSGEGG